MCGSKRHRLTGYVFAHRGRRRWAPLFCRSLREQISRLEPLRGRGVDGAPRDVGADAGVGRQADPLSAGALGGRRRAVVPGGATSLKFGVLNFPGQKNNRQRDAFRLTRGSSPTAPSFNASSRVCGLSGVRPSPRRGVLVRHGRDPSPRSLATLLGHFFCWGGRRPFVNSSRLILGLCTPWNRAA